MICFKKVGFCTKFLCFILALFFLQNIGIKAFTENSYINKDMQYAANPMGEVLGQITDLVTSEKLKDAKLVISNGALNRETTTDVEGMFSFKDVPVGTYTISVNVANYNPATQSDVVINQGIKTVNDFALTKMRGNLTGYVTDKVTSKPIEGVLITITNDKKSYSQTTDSNGKYVISSAYAGVYGATAKMENYNIEGPSSVAITGEPLEKNFALTRQTGGITGRITSSENKLGLSQVLIKVTDGINNYEALTDSNGNFTIDDVYSGTYKVFANLKDYEEKQLTDVLIESGDMASQSFEMSRKAGSVSGKLVGKIFGKVRDDLNGSAIYRAKITLKDKDNTYIAYSDESGYYEINDAIVGNYDMTVEYENYNTKIMSEISINNAYPTEQDIKMKSSLGALKGNVTDVIYGNKIQGAKVVVSNDKNEYIFFTDPNGDYIVNNIKEGTYDVTVSKVNFDKSVANGITVTNGDIISRNFALESHFGSLTGKVVDKNTGDPIPSANIKLANQDKEINTIADEYGNYSIDGVLPGNYDITASLNGYDPSSKYDVTINIAESIKFDFQLLKNIGTANEALGEVSPNETLSNTPIATPNLMGSMLLGSNSVIITPELPTSYNLNVQQPIVESISSANEITGTGTAGDTVVVVMPDGTELKQQIDDSGKWSIAMPSANAGYNIVVYALDNDNNLSANVNVKIVESLPATGEYHLNSCYLNYSKYIALFLFWGMFMMIILRKFSKNI